MTLLGHFTISIKEITDTWPIPITDPNINALLMNIITIYHKSPLPLEWNEHMRIYCNVPYSNLVLLHSLIPWYSPIF